LAKYFFRGIILPHRLISSVIAYQEQNLRIDARQFAESY